MRRMRTIQQAAEWVKETDPYSALTQTAIRRLVLAGDIPHVSAGNKRLVALEDIEDYLAGTRISSVKQLGVVRSVEVR